MSFFTELINGNPQENTDIALKTNHYFDIEIVKSDLKKLYEKQISEIVEQAKQIEVTNTETEKKAISMAGQLKKAIDRIEGSRKSIIKIPDEYVRNVNAFCKIFKDMLNPAIRDLKTRIGNHQYQKEIERREKEKIAEEELKKMQKSLKIKAEKAGVDVPVIVTEVLPVEKKNTVTRTEEGSSAHIRTVWRMTAIQDFSKVPDKYKVLNNKAINAAIKAGIRNIEGLEIKEVPDTVLRK